MRLTRAIQQDSFKENQMVNFQWIFISLFWSVVLCITFWVYGFFQWMIFLVSWHMIIVVVIGIMLIKQYSKWWLYLVILLTWILSGVHFVGQIEWIPFIPTTLQHFNVFSNQQRKWNMRSLQEFYLWKITGVNK